MAKDLTFLGIDFAYPAIGVTWYSFSHACCGQKRQLMAQAGKRDACPGCSGVFEVSADGKGAWTPGSKS